MVFTNSRLRSFNFKRWVNSWEVCCFVVALLGMKFDLFMVLDPHKKAPRPYCGTLPFVFTQI